MVSSTFSGVGQLQQPPAVCKPPPTPQPPVWIPPDYPIKIQVHWWGYIAIGTTFDVSHRFTAYWSEDLQSYVGNTLMPYPISNAKIEPDPVGDMADIVFLFLTTPAPFEEERWYYKNPSNDATWSPPVHVFSQSYPSYTLSGEILLLRA